MTAVAFRQPGRISGRKWYQRAAEIQQANQNLGKIIGLCLADMGEIAAMAAAVRWYRPIQAYRLIKAIHERAAVYKGTETQQLVAGEKKAGPPTPAEIVNADA